MLITRKIAGGKKFSKDLRPLDADGNPLSIWAVRLVSSCIMSVSTKSLTVDSRIHVIRKNKKTRHPPPRTMKMMIVKIAMKTLALPRERAERPS